MEVMINFKIPTKWEKPETIIVSSSEGIDYWVVVVGGNSGDWSQETGGTGEEAPAVRRPASVCDLREAVREQGERISKFRAGLTEVEEETRGLEIRVVVLYKAYYKSSPI